jgi:hypothetical protein
MRPNGLYLLAAAAGAVYGTLFLCARRAVALRAGRLAAAGLCLLLLRLIFVVVGYPLDGWLDAALVVAILPSSFVCLRYRRVWLMRVSLEELREQIASACRGLFLSFEEPSQGQFLFTAQGSTDEIRVLSLTSHIQLVRLPRCRRQSKVGLLVRWLSKQYAAALPTVRIILKRRE